MSNENYKNTCQKYLELRPKVLGAARVTKKQGKYEVIDGNIHNEFIKTRDELEHYLGFLSNEELSAIFLDFGIGPKAGAVLDKRIKK